MRKLEGIDATIIEHSVTVKGDELITFVLQSYKAVDAEFEKHRMISSNSSSDRAIPFNKMKDKEFFIPDDIRLNEKGMQGYTQADKTVKEELKWDLYELRNHVIEVLSLYPEVHKQHLNRYLLPWSYQTKIATMNKDQFYYFLSLRKAEGADPTMIKLAEKMEEAYNWSQPNVLNERYAWHLPFVTEAEWDNAYLSVDDLIKHSVARCARVSYDNHDGTVSSLAKDYELYEWLKQHKHLTPFENQAKPMEVTALEDFNTEWEQGVSHITRKGVLMSGNFKGFIQYRKLIEEKNNA